MGIVLVAALAAVVARDCRGRREGLHNRSPSHDQQPGSAWDLSRTFYDGIGEREPPGGWPRHDEAAPDDDAPSCGAAPDAAHKPPDVVVRAYLDDAARRLLPDGARVARWRLQGWCAAAHPRPGPRAYAFRVLACFLVDGQPRGWCAALDARADASAPDPVAWTFETVSVEPGGAVSEDVLVMHAPPRVPSVPSSYT